MVDSLRDPRAYLQQRVKLFTGVACVFFAALLALDFATPAEGEATFSSTRVASIVVLVSNAVVWSITRRGERSITLVRGLELGTMVAAMAVYATLPLHPPVQGHGGVMAMFTPVPMAVVVLLRAAIIPSPPWLSVAVGVAWGGAMTASSTLGWEGIELVLPRQLVDSPGPEGFAPWKLPFSLGVLTTVAFSFVAGVISHVVHGLQTRVRKAMELGQYTLEAKIGEGGMGVVYRARHRLLRRPTAVKLLPPSKAGERAIARFEREVQQTSRLSHPNTVGIFDFGRTQDGIFYYAMEYLDGISLQHLVDAFGPLPPARVVHVLTQAAAALGEAHAMGLVHRDIKPDNLMLCERGGVPDVVKVLDFGLVKDVDAETQLSAANAVAGTPLYMAPETLSAPETVGPPSDLYALGAVGYFLLSGRHVFRGNVVEVLGQHLHSAPPPLGEDVDDELASVVMRCLEKEPSERYASATELAEALDAVDSAGTWSEREARAWWNAHQEAIGERRAAERVSTDLTVAPL
ncbi:MAG: serine/threonine protein kinase [Myxococcales bacterium]|nr:serine/threonine protein kinase [Myxococcales bacterium]